jgi:hypothetical protein
MRLKRGWTRTVFADSPVGHCERGPDQGIAAVVPRGLLVLLRDGTQLTLRRSYRKRLKNTLLKSV